MPIPAVFSETYLLIGLIWQNGTFALSGPLEESIISRNINLVGVFANMQFVSNGRQHKLGKNKNHNSQSQT